MARTRRDAARVAQGFADHLNQVLNATVSRSRLSIIRDRTVEHPRFDITRVVAGEVRPLELHGTSACLLAQQKIDVDVEQARCLTVTYTYRYQANERPESWLFR